jgi:hypothetical protein
LGRAPKDFHITKVFHFSGVYELPIGAGKRYLANSGKIVDGVLGGWKTNWILTCKEDSPLPSTA